MPSCFIGIREERLLDFVNTIVLRRTGELEAAMCDAKINYKWRIHQLEHKLEICKP